MIEITRSQVPIFIDLPNGVWTINSGVASGKTRLAKLLRGLESLNDTICSFTYEDIARDRDLHKILTNPKYKLIMLDRFDMYSDMELDAISEKSKSAIILLDCKRGFRGDADENFCYIDLRPDRIEVTSEYSN